MSSTVRHGTSNYTTLYAAYTAYGKEQATAKIADGSIAIGKPDYELKPGESFGIYRDEGRYYINRKL